MFLLSAITRSWRNRQIDAYRSNLRRIEAAGSKLAKVNESDLKKASLALRYRALSGTSLDQLLPESFALVREASRRALKMSHYDVQLLGGVSMHSRGIAVMQTGEGKTLTATLPLFLASLNGRGSHLATANDYLAQRDAQLMRPLFELLGCSVGIVCSDTGRPERLAAYACDVTYTTAKEIGFDFLRDRLLRRQMETGQVDRKSVV